MKRQTFLYSIVICCSFTASLLAKINLSKEPFEINYGNSTFRWDNKLRLDGFYSKNARMLNNANGDLDRAVIPGRFILDSALHNYYRNPDCKWDTVHAKAGIRCKGTFGAPGSTLRTAPAPIKDLDAVLGSHFHPLEINIPIVREVWGEFMLNDLLQFGFEKQHTFTMGLFPFSLGRGIALGDAYAVAPDFIGYDPANAVDQYAPGMKISGELYRDHILDYDLYAGINDNFSESFNSVNLKTQGQFYGRRFNQARGFGIIDYTLAGRLKWTPVADKECKIYLEPYALFNDERNQKVEIPGDASSKLGTFGLSGELRRGDFEFGFDVAQNIGNQHVKGLDRNIVTKEMRITNSFDQAGNLTTGNITVPVFVNSHVVTIPPNVPGARSVKVPFNVDSSLQAAIDAPIKGVTACGSLEALNGQTLSVQLPNQGGAPISVRNANDRFRDPYVNEFCGQMLVMDCAWRARPNLRIAGTVGYASGDENPNKDLDELGESTEDGTYCGFIGLQELYTGKRVRSAFLMSGSGKIPRVLSYPVNRELNPNVSVPTNEYPAVLTRFTNLAFVGGALWYETETCSSKWDINPNVLVYWQPRPPRVFDLDANIFTAERRVDPLLGAEFNIFVDVSMAPGLKLFLVTGFFLPGPYYDQLKGYPLSKAEKAYLDSLDDTGEAADVTPVLGNDNAFFINAGIEYRF